MKKGDKIIWNSNSGYDIGYYISYESNQYMKCTVHIISNKYTYDTSEFPHYEILPYNDENLQKMIEKYGYEKKFD